MSESDEALRQELLQARAKLLRQIDILQAMPQSDIFKTEHMAKLARGLYRNGFWVYVTDGTVEFDVRRADYRANGYQPDFKNLPSKRDYDIARKAAEKAKKDSNA